VIWLLLTIVFFVTQILPGDPIRVMMGPQASQFEVDRMRHLYGLDKPAYLQYFDYLGKIVRLDFGQSFQYAQPVISLLAERFPVTLEIIMLSLTLSMVLGITSGIVAAVEHDKIVDHLIRVVVVLSFAIPSFVLAILLQLAFSVNLNILPLSGRIDVPITRITGAYLLDSLLTLNPTAFVDALKHLIIPVFTSFLWTNAAINRLTRGSMISVLQEQYVQTARAKGLSETKVIFKHAFRNAVVPVFTLVALYFGVAFIGNVIVENIFSLPGLGRLLLSALLARDYPLIQGCVSITAIAMGVASATINVGQVFLDPRVR
jgi:peptide/nickel transport system permease protein